MDCKQNIIDTAHDILEYYREVDTPVELQADAVVVKRKGILFNYKFQEQFVWKVSPSQFPNRIGWYFEDWGDNVLAGLLIYLHTLPASSIALQESFLKAYLTHDLKLNRLQYIGR